MGDGAPNGEQSVPIGELRNHVLLEYSSAAESLRRRRHRKIIANLAKMCPSPSSSAARSASSQSKSLKALECVGQLDIPAVVLPQIEKLPDGISWVRATTNLRLPECFSDNYYVPYLGESEEHQASSSKLAKILCDEDSEKEDNSDVEGLEADPGTSSSSSEEDDDGIGVVIVGADLNLKSKEKRRLRRLATKNGRKDINLPPSGKIGEFKWDRQAKLIAIQRFSAVFLPPNCDELTPDCAKAVREAFRLTDENVAHAYMTIVTKRVQMWETKKKGEDQLDTVKAEVINHIQGNGSSSAAAILKGDSIPFFFCRQCYVYDCPLHENCDSGPTVPIPDRTRKDSTTKQVTDDIEKGCRDRSAGDCWCLGSKDDDCAKWWADSYDTSVNLVDDLKALLKALLPTFGKDFCRVSETVRTLLRDSHDITYLTCCRIGYVSNVLFSDLLETPFPSRVKKFQKMRSCKPAAELDFMNGGIRPDYKPCRHDGPCTAENCICVANGVFCEKYCGCNHSRPKQMKQTRRCNYAFPGCSCKSACSSNLCPCYSWKRECDPDLCRYCHECRKTTNGKSNFACRNVNLRLKRNCRVLAGRSSVHGWGVFAAHDIPQNEMVGEYVGEVLGDQVAERRGRLYDEVQSTFLFEITKGLSLDSTRIGNKLRYCNHSSDANLEPRLMRVGGDVRIGIFARRAIQKHEELFFNYGSKFQNRWEMKDSKDGKAELRSTKHVKSIAIVLKSDDENDDFTGFGERSSNGKGVRNKMRKLKNGRDAVQELDRRNQKNMSRHRRRNSLQEPVAISNDSNSDFEDDLVPAGNKLRIRRHSMRHIRGSRFTPLLKENDESRFGDDNDDDDEDNDSTLYRGISFRSASETVPGPRVSNQGKRKAISNQEEPDVCTTSKPHRKISGQHHLSTPEGTANAGSSVLKKNNQEKKGSTKESLVQTSNIASESWFIVGRVDAQTPNNENECDEIDGKRLQTSKLRARPLESKTNSSNSRALKSKFNGLDDEMVSSVENDPNAGAVDYAVGTSAATGDSTIPELAGKHVMSSVSDTDADKAERENSGNKDGIATSGVTPLQVSRGTRASSGEDLRSSKRRLSNQAKPQLSLETVRNTAKRHKVAKGIGAVAHGRRVAKALATPPRNILKVSQDNGTSSRKAGTLASQQKTPGDSHYDRWEDRGTVQKSQPSKSKRGFGSNLMPRTSSLRDPTHQSPSTPSSLRAGEKGSTDFIRPTERPVANNPATELASEVINLITDDEDEPVKAASSLNRGDDSDASFDPKFGKYKPT